MPVDELEKGLGAALSETECGWPQLSSREFGARPNALAPKSVRHGELLPRMLSLPDPSTPPFQNCLNPSAWSWRPNCQGLTVDPPQWGFPALIPRVSGLSCCSALFPLQVDAEGNQEPPNGAEHQQGRV